MKNTPKPQPAAVGTSALLACPFCGDEAFECAETDIPSMKGKPKLAVYCDTCFCEGPPADSQKEAIEAWNGRASLMSLRLERDDSIPAFGAFLRCEAQHDKSPVILINVQSCMAPSLMAEDNSEVPMTREERKRLIIQSIMHEFGHALESLCELPVNEDAIEKACQAWEEAYQANTQLSGGTPAPTEGSIS